VRHIAANQPFIYLGFPLRLDLDSADAIAHTIRKTEKAVEQLAHTCYTSDQLLMLFNCCVVPLFRYTAPLAKWAPKDLEKIDSLWTRAHKYAYKFPSNFPNAPFSLGPQVGGLGITPSTSFLIKELKAHIQQCLQHQDKLNMMLKLGTRRELTLAGLPTLEHVFSPERSTFWTSQAYQSPSPVWRLQFWLKDIGTLKVDWLDPLRQHRGGARWLDCLEEVLKTRQGQDAPTPYYLDEAGEHAWKAATNQQSMVAAAQRLSALGRTLLQDLFPPRGTSHHDLVTLLTKPVKDAAAHAAYDMTLSPPSGQLSEKMKTGLRLILRALADSPAILQLQAGRKALAAESWPPHPGDISNNTEANPPDQGR
jgi:hypothetical protein